MGLAVTFVPIAVVNAFLPIEMTGGQSLLWMVDLDVLVMDAGAIAVIAMLWRRRRLIGDRLPLVLFGLIAAATIAALLGYVVTNFGTLSRMRPLIGAPLWMLAAALAPQPTPPAGTARRAQTPATV